MLSSIYPSAGRRMRRVRVDQLAHRYWSAGKFRTVLWRRGSKGKMRGQFYAVRIRSAERRTKKKRASEPLCSLPKKASLKEVVRLDRPQPKKASGHFRPVPPGRDVEPFGLLMLINPSQQRSQTCVYFAYASTMLFVSDSKQSIVFQPSTGPAG